MKWYNFALGVLVAVVIGGVILIKEDSPSIKGIKQYNQTVEEYREARNLAEEAFLNQDEYSEADREVVRTAVYILHQRAVKNYDSLTHNQRHPHPEAWHQPYGSVANDRISMPALESKQPDTQVMDAYDQLLQRYWEKKLQLTSRS